MLDRDRPSDDGTEPVVRKDRLIQARVPRHLESTIKQEARRRRLSVSHLIRNVLEDTFDLVDGVVADVDKIVSDSVALAENVRRRGRRLGAERPAPLPTAAGFGAADLGHVFGWQELVLHSAVTCSQCGVEIGRGQKAYAGQTDEPRAARAWLCAPCIADL